MLDVKLVRERPEFVKERLAIRGAGDERHIDGLLALDEARRVKLAAAEQLKAQRNAASKEIGALIAQRKGTEAESRKAEVRGMGEQISVLDREVTAIGEELAELLLRLPNLPHESVVPGQSPEENLWIRSWGEPREFGFSPWTHVELCQRLRLVDFERGAKLAGSGFLLYTGWGARLERALIQFMLDLHTREHGYTEVSPPFLVGHHCMVGVGQFPKFIDQAYTVRQGMDDTTIGKLFLVPTAEAPVANIHREEILAAEQLPVRYVAYSPCFRAEAGAAGVGTRGMIRVHQFDKVEMIKIVRSEVGYAELESMVENAERVLQLLELHYRVLALCSGDLGFASAKTYDLELWAPGQRGWLEVSSCSNCEDYQARRMHLRFKDADGQNKFPHILNGSGTALARLFVALVETHQQADGSVKVPGALQNYLGSDRIVPSTGT